MIVERIKQIVEYYQLSDRAFCRSIEVAPGWLNNAKNIGSDKLERILTEYNKISPAWLILGEGSMVRQAPVSATKVHNIDYKRLYDECKDHNKSLKQVIDLLRPTK